MGCHIALTGLVTTEFGMKRNAMMLEINVVFRYDKERKPVDLTQ